MNQNNNDVQDFISELIRQAQEHEAMEFHQIRSWLEFRAYYKCIKATRIVINMLKRSTKKVIKSYYKELVKGSSEFEELLAYVQLCDIVDFYENELITIKSMVSDYYDYLCQGNFWYAFLGGERE